MSKNKSLGSSPIGFQSGDSTMGFIPDLGVSKSSKSNSSSSSHTKSTSSGNSTTQKTEEENSPEKKIVSYNLEVDLIEKIKSMAKENEIYYSSLVSLALKTWISEQK